MPLEGGNMALAATDELLQAQAHIWNHIFQFSITSMALKCAVQLGIPDAVQCHGAHPMPLSQLVSSLQLHPTKSQYIHRLMRLLTHSGFFVTHKVMTKNGDEEEEAYVLTNSSRLLLKDNPLTLAPFLLSSLEPALMESWQFLSAWLQSEDRATPLETAHGRAFWEYMGDKPSDGGVFNTGLASDARLVMSVLMGKYKGGSLVDVGGGTGTVAKLIAQAFPLMECTVFDLPQVVADLKGKDNLKYVGGDMFVTIPPGDALLLKSILHDWSDEECVKILKKCKEAITSDEKKGKVIVIDMVVGNTKMDDMLNETQLFSDMTMMVLVNGKERNEKEWAQLFRKAGFSDYKIFPILGLRSLIEIYP